MQEIGILNINIASAIARQGHTDELIVCDSGFAIPIGVEVIDVSLKYNVPTVLEVLELLNKYHSVEKIVMAEETYKHNPTFFKNVSMAFGENIEVQRLAHADLKARSKNVKTVIRTGDCTAYGNVLLVSGAGNRWKLEVE